MDEIKPIGKDDTGKSTVKLVPEIIIIIRQWYSTACFSLIVNHNAVRLAEIHPLHKQTTYFSYVV